MKNKICKVEGCKNKVLAKDYCNKHYRQLKYHGKILNKSKFDSNEFVDCGNYYKIILENHKHEEVGRTLIDKEDYEIIKDYKWCLGEDGYATTFNKNRHLKLHKLIFSEIEEVDHKNRDRLDNRKINLRSSTSAENSYNKSIRSDNKSGTTGIHWDQKRKKWTVQIGKDAKVIFLGCFTNFNDAVDKRKKAEKDYFGEFAPKRKRIRRKHAGNSDK